MDGLHKVSGLLGATWVYDEEREKIEWARQDRGGDGGGFPPETDRVARLSLSLTKPDFFISHFKPLYLVVSVYSVVIFIFRHGTA
jgi:hypothetical protein